MTIQLTHELVFAAKYGGATMEARPPILKKAHKQDDEGGVGELTMEVTYQTTAEGQEHEVDIGDRGKGYLYGPEYVPFSKDDEDNFKIHTDKVRESASFPLEVRHLSHGMFVWWIHRRR